MRNDMQHESGSQAQKLRSCCSRSSTGPSATPQCALAIFCNFSRVVEGAEDACEGVRRLLYLKQVAGACGIWLEPMRSQGNVETQAAMTQCFRALASGRMKKMAQAVSKL